MGSHPRPIGCHFTYVFAKNVAATLTQPGQEALARAAASFADADDRQLAALLQAEDVREIACDGDDPT